jgi:hypothetical protein
MRLDLIILSSESIAANFPQNGVLSKFASSRRGDTVIAKFARLESIPIDSREWSVNATNKCSGGHVVPRAGPCAALSKPRYSSDQHRAFRERG